MKISVLFAAMVAGALAGIASAAPLPCIDIGPTMADYLATGNTGCTIGDKLFNNFIYASTGGGTGAPVPSTAVFLTPVNAGTYTPGPGIVFSSAGWLVPGPSPIDDSYVDSTIGFTVTVLGGFPMLEDATLILSSFSASGIGFGNITETLTPLGLQLQVDSSGPLTDHVTFAPRNSISVLKDLVVAIPAGVVPGSAQINSFEEDFSQVPEPGGMVLIGSGLLALGIWRRRGSLRS